MYYETSKHTKAHTLTTYPLIRSNPHQHFDTLLDIKIQK